MEEGRQGVFSTLPENFFSPLARANREHYAALLSLFYRFFQESTQGVERNALVTRMAEYISAHRAQISEEEAEDVGEADSPAEASAEPARALASRMLRRLERSGWLSLEELPDYTRVVNMQAWAKPFLEALAKVEEGLKTEYESHVVAVYSLLCADAAMDNGHYAVQNAHASTVALGDSLKVLSQSIKEHYERLSALSGGKISELLHLHYDLYQIDVHGAYRRLKTSDNLSRYRPKILKRVSEFLTDGAWMDSSAAKYARTARLSHEESRRRLSTMLQEIRDILRSIDPLLDEIDRRNMLYSKASVERVRVMLEPESSLSGRIALAARAIASGGAPIPGLSHHAYQVRLLAPESRYSRWLREALSPVSVQAPPDRAGLERAEAELRLRLARQLGPDKIAAWLDASGGRERALSSAELVRDADSFVRLLYAVIYADGRRGRFRYRVQEGPAGRLRAGGYEMPDLVFRGKE